jgi:hypothetical protein
MEFDFAAGFWLRMPCPSSRKATAAKSKGNPRPMPEPADNNSAERPTGWLWGPLSAQALWIATLTLIIDQANKLWLLFPYDIRAKGRVQITPFFDLVFVRNTGVSYSMLDSDSYSWQLGLAGFAGVATIALWLWLHRRRHKQRDRPALAGWGGRLLFVLCVRVFLVCLQHRRCGDSCWGRAAAVRILHRESQSRRKTPLAAD